MHVRIRVMTVLNVLTCFHFPDSGFKFSQLEMSTYLTLEIVNEWLNCAAGITIEVILAVLLTTFRFSLASGENANIIWNRAGVAYPSCGPERSKPRMPLKVEALVP